MKKFFEEFKTFAMRGNVLDMAVGVVIGAAFGKITTSLVNDIIMPLLSLITGGLDFSEWKWVLNKNANFSDTTPITVNFGSLVSVVLDFIIVAFAMFLLVKAMNKITELAKKKEEIAEAESEAPAAPTTEELLCEIRDLLKERKGE